MNIDELIADELAAVAGRVDPPPAPVAALVAAGREEQRRRRWVTAGSAAAAAAVVAGVVWAGAAGGGDDARHQDPAGPSIDLDLPTGALPQVPIQVGGTTYVDGRALEGDFGPVVGDGQGGVAAVAGTQRWRVLTEPGVVMLPAAIVGTPAAHPDGDRVAYVDRDGRLALWSSDGTRDNVIHGPTPARKPLLEGMDSAGNVYFTGEGPSAQLRVWNPAGGRDHPVTFAGAPVSLVQVLGAGLVFSAEPGGEALLGVPDARGRIHETRGLPDNATLAVSASGDRVAWLTDGKDSHPEAKDGWDGYYRSVTVEKLAGPPGTTRIDLPAGTDVRAVEWEDETHVLVLVFADERGISQSLLRCDVAKDEPACEYAAPPTS